MKKLRLHAASLIICGSFISSGGLLAEEVRYIPEGIGLVYENNSNKWIQSVEFKGRFHYQVVRVDGKDVNDLEFKDDHDEYRRIRLGVEIDLLQYFETEVEVNLVSDDRFRDGPGNDIDWGYDQFHDATVEFNAGEAFDISMLDTFKLKYGRMKLRMGAEQHQSSREIYTIERSSISEKLGGELSRPTGFTVEFDKGDWELVLGVYSAEDDSEFLADWDEGLFYYASLEWEPTEQLTILLDYSQNDFSYLDDALGYAWAGVLSTTYEEDRWGIMTQLIYGDNGGGVSEPDSRRQGNFEAIFVMPWYWLLEDKLQLVCQYQYARSSKEQGLQLPSRYIRGGHENPLVDVDNGRGDEHHYFYSGINYHIQKDQIKLMLGASYDELSTRKDRQVSAVTWQAALRLSF